MGHYIEPQVERYSMSSGLRSTLIGVIILGLVMTVLGVVLNTGHPTRIWTTLLHNSYFFLGLGLAGMFYVAAQTIGYSGWVVLVSRIPEAMSRAVPVFALIFGAVLIFGYKSIYHWAHDGIMDPTSSHYDELIHHKQFFLNPVFFFGATAVYLGLWVLLTWMIRRNSYAHDSEPGMARYRRAKVLCMFFLFVFAVSTSTGIWQWFMSIDPHWYSTLYGWYCFISIFVASIAAINLIVLYLKSMGHLKYINTEHFHDLGKWMFAFSVAWAYLWFSQFMLIWYSNIPEETLYFKDRFIHYKFAFFFNFIINFPLPFLVLMTARNKRNPKVLVFVATCVLVGHWLDYYLLAMPGAIKGAAYMDGGHLIHNFGFGFMELGVPLLFGGIFAWIAFDTLSRHSLVPVNHPFVQESLTHATHSI